MCARLARTYHGQPDGKTIHVTVNKKPLAPRLDLAEKALGADKPRSAQFEWGCLNDKVVHTAIAILSDYFGDDAKAMKHCSDFANELARIRGTLTITGSYIEEYLGRTRTHTPDMKLRRD